MALYCSDIFGDMLLKLPLDSHPVSLFYVTSLTRHYSCTAILSPSLWFEGRAGTNLKFQLAHWTSRSQIVLALRKSDFFLTWKI